MNLDTLSVKHRLDFEDLKEKIHIYLYIYAEMTFRYTGLKKINYYS
jgi:hypothetical protein